MSETIHDGKYHRYVTGEIYKDGLFVQVLEELNTLAARIAELEAANCWIPCAERHPDYDVWVLVLANGEVFPAAYSEKNGWYTELAKWGAFITHWRPLPPPPEEREEG